MTHLQFKRWQKRLQLSNARAAEQLRVQERQIYNYRSGDNEITPTVERLCELIELCHAHGLIELPAPYSPPAPRPRAPKRSRTSRGEVEQ